MIPRPVIARRFLRKRRPAIRHWLTPVRLTGLVDTTAMSRIPHTQTPIRVAASVTRAIQFPVPPSASVCETSSLETASVASAMAHAPRIQAPTPIRPTASDPSPGTSADKAIAQGLRGSPAVRRPERVSGAAASRSTVSMPATSRSIATQASPSSTRTRGSTTE